MSSYPVLDNRPIDQWKVTELKEELKRRKLTTRGLKDDLIRRLDEALRVEREKAEKEKAEEEKALKEKAEREKAEWEKAEENAERENAEREKAEKENAERETAERDKQVDNGIESDPPNSSSVDNSETVPSGSANNAAHSDKNDEKVDDDRVAIDVNEGLASSDQAVQAGVTAATGVAEKVDELTAPATTEEPRMEVTAVETIIEVKESTVNLAEQGQQNPEKQENKNPEKQDGSENQLEDGNLKHQLESGDMKMPPQEDAVLDSPAPNNQVSEVSYNLGFQVKSDSVNNDSVSINEKNEFKDNITADNIKLELDVVKPEMVEPSSSDVVPAGGESHPMDVKELHESKVADQEKEDKNNSMSPDMSKNNEIADLGYSEKLNLDRSSGDDSMEEDVPENKHIDSKHNEDEVGDKNEKTEVTAVKEESPVDVVGDDEKVIKVEKSQQSTLAEKRKLNDGGYGSSEPVKRQRRWQSEGIKVPEPQGSNLTPTTTPKDTLQTPTSKRNFMRSDSTVSDDAPKERGVPPPQKPATNSLRIDRFLRPFTLKAVQELLGKTGTVKSFWMDQIKTHCYVTYSSVEEAVETRNAVYNLQWPPNGGRLLVAEFVEPEEVKARLEAPPQAPAPTPTPAAQTLQPPAPRQQAAPPKQQLPPPPPLPPPPAPERERGVHLPPPPPLSEKVDPTIVTLDNLKMVEWYFLSRVFVGVKLSIFLGLGAA
ncbi:hypothetical protein CRG98_003269 [Punica granatum]|uniref:SAP domain-containing protein n=1 Tax=Punica granatum TaxID=22663 RepID=A0A2I0L6L8_PUNGR|nr:hypothetical protein CRG98_003269 [Punica granatum]